MSEIYQYHIIVHSRWRLIVYFYVLFCAGLLVFDKLSLDAKMLMTILIIAWLILSFFISFWLSRGKLRLALSEEEIKCYWERRFFLSFAKGWSAPWKLTKNYFIYGDRTFDCFVLNFTNGYCFRFHRFNNLPIRDNYKKFIRNFEKNANELMRRTDENASGLKRCADIYECEEYDEKALKRRKILCIITMVLLSLIVLACLIDALIHGSIEFILLSILWEVFLAWIFHYEMSSMNRKK